MFLGGVGSGIYGPAGLYGAPDGFPSITLTVQSPPQSFTEPLSLQEVKAFLKLPARSPVDSDEDTLLNAFISAARGQAEILQNRDLVIKQWDMVFDYWLGYYIRLSRSPLISVDLFQFKDSTGAVTPLILGTDYIVDAAKTRGRVIPPYNSLWHDFTPWPSSAILLRYTSGVIATSAWWQADGAVVKAGMKRLISDWFNNRLPFEKGLDPMREYPYGVTAALSQGAIRIVG